MTETEESWRAVACYCETVMMAKEEIGRERRERGSIPPPPRAQGPRRVLRGRRLPGPLAPPRNLP